MSRLQKLERRIDEKLRHALRSSSDQTPEPIEVHRAIVDEVGSRVDTLPRGRLSFGYSQVNVRVLVQKPERRRSYEIVFLEADSLTRDIKTHLEERKVEFPPRLRIDVTLVDSLPIDVSDRGFDVSYSNPSGSPQVLHGVQVQLSVLVGNAEQKQYCFTKNRINLGRLVEVLDSDLRMVRRNDLALNDDSTVANSTVSRAHAHLEYDPEASRFRLFDDGSAHGTTVVREASVIPVPKGTSKGVLLERGDEILLGKVHILFEYGDN